MKLGEHRAAARIAWRSARRAKGRSALVVALVALPILALTGAGFFIKTVVPTPEEKATGQLGSADLAPTGFSTELATASIAAALPAGSIVADVRTIFVTRRIGGEQRSIQFIEPSVPPDQPPVAARYALLRGRMPVARNEVAVHPDVLEWFRVGIGDRLAIEGTKGRGRAFEEFFGAHGPLDLRVVGIAVQREAFRFQIALVGPGTLGDSAEPASGWLIDLPPGVSIDRGRRALERAGAFEIDSRDDVINRRRREEQVQTGMSFGGAVGGLFGTGLIVAAALGVGARRQLRTLGLVGAAGGDRRHVRAVVLWGGSVLGLTGSVIGIALGAAAAYAVTPHVDVMADRIVGPVRLPWTIIAGGLALGTIAATAAAFGPARQAARQTTVDALAGRTPKPRPAGPLAGRGLAAVIAGSVLTAAGTIWHQDKLAAGALVLTVSGFLFMIPMLVTWVGRTPARLPMSLRLAARQTARYGRRTGAAVAAATIALTAPVAVAAFSLSDEAYQHRQVPLAADQIFIGGYNPDDPEGGLPDGLLDAARNALPGSIVGAIRYAKAAGDADPNVPGVQRQDVWVDGEQHEVSPGVYTNESSPLAIAGADLLRAARAERALVALESGKIVGLGIRTEGSTINLRIAAGSKDPSSVPAIKVPFIAVRTADLAKVSEIPRYYISERAAARYHLVVGSTHQGLLRAPHDLTDDEIAKVKRAVAGFTDAYAHARGDLMFNSNSARLLVTGGAALVALIIVGVAVALVGAESRRERSMLVAVGAEPSIRRKTAAANAFYVSALAGILAIPAGFLPVVIVEIARRANRPIVVPWNVMGIVAIGAPLLAAAIAGMTSREPPSRSLLQPIW